MLQARFLQPITFVCHFTLAGFPKMSFMLAKHLYLLTTWQMAFGNSRFVCLLDSAYYFALSFWKLHCPPVQHCPNLPQVYHLYTITVALYMKEFYGNQPDL